MPDQARTLVRRSLDDLVGTVEALDKVVTGDPHAQLAPLLVAACQLQLDLQLAAPAGAGPTVEALATVRELCSTLCLVRPGARRAARHAGLLVSRLIRLLGPQDAAA